MRGNSYYGNPRLLSAMPVMQGPLQSVTFVTQRLNCTKQMRMGIRFVKNAIRQHPSIALSVEGSKLPGRGPQRDMSALTATKNL